MNGLNWIPQLKSNNTSIENTNRKKKYQQQLRLTYISTNEDNFKRMVLYLKILEPDALNVVDQDMNDKGITETNLPFWYSVNDNELILKVSSQNCKCYTNMTLNVGFEKDVEYNVDVKFKRYTTKE